MILGLQKTGWALEFAWIPSHVGIPGNEVADSIATPTDTHDNPTIILHRFVEARLTLWQIIRVCQPDAFGMLETNTPPIYPPRRGTLRSDLVIRLVNCAGIRRSHGCYLVNFVI